MNRLVAIASLGNPMNRLVAIASLVALMIGCQRAGHPDRSLGIEKYPSARDLYGFAETYRVKHKLPALGVGIIHRGQIVGLGMAGERAVRSADWATIDDAFDIASCSKSVTATMAALLVEEKKVRWETTLGEAFPELKAAMHPSYAIVTLEQLLRHRSGLGRIMDRNDRWAGWHREHNGKSATEQRRLFVSAALKPPPRSPPGTEDYYTNDAYLIVGSLLERAAGVDWETLVRTRLFLPLGLASMRYGVWADRAHVQVSGHEDGWFNRPQALAANPAEYGNPPFGSPGGFLYCSVPDLLRWVDFHTRGEKTGHTLLSRESLHYLRSPIAGQTWALGWQVEVERGADGRVIHSVFHGGYSGRARANMWFGPETQWGTVIVMNHGRGGEAVTTDIFYALLREFGLLPAAAPAK
jgi:CubicO group peptidase (beta-lactamase class C family)